MIKIEQLRGTDTFKRLIVPSASSVSASSQIPMLQKPSNVVSQRSIDLNAIDISSIKGRFAWERIPFGDTYIPVIFRGATKLCCIKMLRKLLHEYPEDVIRSPSFYQYRKPIDIYAATSNEIKLLNRINGHHSHWTYSRQPLTGVDQLVRLSDFLPFYEHLRTLSKTKPVARTASAGSFRKIHPQSLQAIQSSTDFVIDMSNVHRRHSIISPTTIPIQMQSCTSSKPFCERTASVSRLTALTSSVPRLSQPPKQSMHVLSPSHLATQLQPQLLPSSTQQPIATSSTDIIKPINTTLPINVRTVALSNSASQPMTLATPNLPLNPSFPNSEISSTSITKSRKPSRSSSDKQLTLTSKQPKSSSPTTTTTPTSSSSKASHLKCGWLQINKLYTPYISTNMSNHHLYKIPVSLLTFYDLLKIPYHENNPNESKDISFPFEQTPVTPQEIELINELCIQQNIKPFSIDTKLIDLSTFYKHCSANIIFVKELPLNEPKTSICKDWSSIVQINGGICRLRNITTLHEQTVPFIGKNLLKNFIISSQCLASALLTTPTSSEIQFLQLILFFSNMSINICNAKLIDIESVQKEYNVDLILLFNDKFPLNVLNYQQQGLDNRTPQRQFSQSDSSAATNTFAESTPPPSPPSPPTNNAPASSSAQFPLISSSSSSSSNRYQKTITFHGHSMTAYICSGLGLTSQRECISIRALCNILYPNSMIIDKLESKMLRLLRSKNINRFRSQNQQSISLTRLVDVKDVEKHWDYIEEGMRSLSNNDEETLVTRKVSSSFLNPNLKASTLDNVENNSESIEHDTSSEVYKNEKRPLERALAEEEEEVPDMERIDKRIRLSSDDVQKQPVLIQFQSTKTINSICDKRDDKDDSNGKVKNQRSPSPSGKIVRRESNTTNLKTSTSDPTARISRESSTSSCKSVRPAKKKIRIIKKRRTPRLRLPKQSTALWAQKYNIEECCIRLDAYRLSDENRSS